MSASSASVLERDNQLLSVGHQCSASTCGLVDFLPFKCQHCSKPFCGEHFLPQAHKCEKYDESKHNRVAPSCPLCSEPVAIPPGMDPNIKMEQHISTECSVMTGKAKTSSIPHCAKPKCGKVLFAPIQCSTCKQQFCPQHRFPKDHICVAPSVTASTASGGKPSHSAAAARVAAVAALKRAMNTSVGPAGTTATVGRSQPPPSPVKSKVAMSPVKAVAPTTASASSHKPNLFSKIDRSLISPTTTTVSSPSNANNTSTATPNFLLQHCAPKPTDDPRSFTPPPLFGYA